MDPEPMRLALIRLGLLQEGGQVSLTPLTGGIASDIWKVDLPSSTLCIKRALHRLKVKADWFVPIERNLYEWSYLEIADRAAPGSAPRLVARDTKAYLFVMEYLEPERYPLGSISSGTGSPTPRSLPMWAGGSSRYTRTRRRDLRSAASSQPMPSSTPRVWNHTLRPPLALIRTWNRVSCRSSRQRCTPNAFSCTAT